MIFGFNTDVSAGDAVYHVQTEDRGAKNPLVESIIYVGGQIVSRKKTAYVPEMEPERIAELVRGQHKELVEAIRGGTWVPDGEGKPQQTRGYEIELRNASNLLDGESLRFRFAIRSRSEIPGAGDVTLRVRWMLDGTVAESRELRSQPDEEAAIVLNVPDDSRAATLLVCAEGPSGRELAKFNVRPERSNGT